MNSNDVELIRNPASAITNNSILMPQIMIPETSFDFGEIMQGESVVHNFLLRNIGDAKLIITSARGSCGCTVPDWPKEPILPGKEAYIQVVFNSAGRKGKQKKTVTLLTNAIPNTKVLTITGDIIEIN